MTVTGEPAVAVEGALTAKSAAGPALTATAPEVPVMEEVTVSVAVMLWEPAVSSVTWKVPVPLVRVVSAGRLAAPSELVKCTVPW
jgi:hypothetical protein